MTRAAVAAGTLAVLLLLAACSGSPDAGGGAGAAASPERGLASGPSQARGAESEPEAAVATTPPPDRGCYRLRFAELTEPTTDRDPVPCSDRHDAQTIHVGRLDTVVDGHAVSVDSAHVREQLARRCRPRLARFLGGTREDRRLSRFEVVWFSPTLREYDAGADWFRCDVVALAGGQSLQGLARPRRLEGVLSRNGALATYGLCGTAAPGAKGFTRVICDRRHSWRAIGTIDIPGPDAFPGVATVRRGGDVPCKELASGLAEDPLQFQYGWEWPTEEQWAAGQRYGYCWVPD